MIVRRARRALSLELETDLDFPTGRHRRAFQRFRRVASGSITLHLAINRPIFPSRSIDLFQKRDGSRGCAETRENSFPDRGIGICSLYIITSSNVISSRIRFRLLLQLYLFVGNWILKGKHDLDAVY